MLFMQVHSKCMNMWCINKTLTRHCVLPQNTVEERAGHAALKTTFQERGNSWPHALTAWHLTWFSWLWNWLIYNIHNWKTSGYLWTFELSNTSLACYFYVNTFGFWEVPFTTEPAWMTKRSGKSLRTHTRFARTHSLRGCDRCQIWSGSCLHAVSDVQRATGAFAECIFKYNSCSVTSSLPLSCWSVRVSILFHSKSCCFTLRCVYFPISLSNKCLIWHHFLCSCFCLATHIQWKL